MFLFVQIGQLRMQSSDCDESLPWVPSQPHDHLKTASFRGSIFNKDLIALALYKLYILRSAGSLELMTVRSKYRFHRWIADHFLRGEDPRNMVNII
jgi:hypothetical protein